MVTLTETKLNSPKIVTERVGEIRVGRLVIPTLNLVRWESNPTFLRYFNALNHSVPGSKAEDLRRSIVFSMNNNTPNTHSILCHERPVSAYFTFDPQEKQVIIEWGTIDPEKGDAKLHIFLNQIIDYPDRIRQGMKLSSGHIARAGVTSDEIYLALLDNLPFTNTRLSKNDPMGRLINALHFAGFIPLGGDGSVKLPAF